MVSIIVPVFNAENYLTRCIESILGQSISKFELILIDDGSTDASGQICDGYAVNDNRIRVIHSPNRGVSSARNIGIDESKGEWICFIDSDDFIDRDFLANFHLEENFSDLLIQGIEFYDSIRDIFFKRLQVESKVLEIEEFQESIANNKLLHLGYPFAKAYKRNLLVEHQIRFKTNISFHEDHVFVLEVMRLAQRIQLIDSVAYKYRVSHSSNSLSSKRHSWIMLNESSDQMLLCLDNMSDRFLIKGSSYWKSIYTFAYYPKIEAVYEIFRANQSRHARKECFDSVIKEEQIRVMFCPRDAKHKIIRFILAFMPYSIVVMFMCILVKWQSRNIG